MREMGLEAVQVIYTNDVHYSTYKIILNFCGNKLTTYELIEKQKIDPWSKSRKQLDEIA